MAQSLGIRSMLIGANVLHNLAFVSYFKELHMMRESILMASELTSSIFKISLPHPLIACKYGEYRLREITLKDDPFKDTSILEAGETMLSMEKISWMLLDSDIPIKTLPMLTLMDYIATDLI